jgi:hypothetical protein
MPLVRIRAWLAVLALFLIPCCRSDDDGVTFIDPDPNPFTIGVAATEVTSGSIRLAVTASFTASNTPLWRTDKPGFLAHFDLQAGTPSFYTDTDVAPGLTYCYRAGGDYFLIGPVYSNEACVTTPP